MPSQGTGRWEPRAARPLSLHSFMRISPQGESAPPHSRFPSAATVTWPPDCGHLTLLAGWRHAVLPLWSPQASRCPHPPPGTGRRPAPPRTSRCPAPSPPPPPGTGRRPAGSEPPAPEDAQDSQRTGSSRWLQICGPAEGGKAVAAMPRPLALPPSGVAAGAVPAGPWGASQPSLTPEWKPRPVPLASVPLRPVLPPGLRQGAWPQPRPHVPRFPCPRVLKSPGAPVRGCPRPPPPPPPRQSLRPSAARWSATTTAPGPVCEESPTASTT